MRKITLRHLEIRPARSFAQFLPGPLAAKVTDFFALGGKAGTLVEWVSAAVSSCPEEVELASWMRACAAYCLRKPEWQAALRPQLFMGLVESALLDEKISLAAALELVHEISLFSGHWDLTHTSSFAAWGFQKIGEAAARRGEKKAYSLMKPWIFSTPSIFGKGLHPLPSVLIRRELLAHMSAGDWDSVEAFCRELRYWNRRGNPQLPAVAWLASQTEVKEAVEWAEVALAQRKGPGQGARGVPLIHHPLVTEYSKDGYNTLAEFAASIKGRAFNDACLILTSSDNSYISGLLPDLQEKELLVSWRLSLARAFEDSPELSRTLQKKYAQLAGLRLRKAQVRGDVEAVDAVTRQFYGTEAAVEAFLWMGDQALGIGESTLAEGYYRRARKTAPASILYMIEARERLAAAFTGREIGSAPTKAIRFGELTLEPADFEKMASDLRKRFQEKTVSYDNDPAIEPSRKVPTAGVYSALSLAQFDFDPRFKDFRPNIPAQKTDWVGRQMALTVYDDYLLVSDRNDLRAYGLPGGELRWSHLAGSQRGGSREWPLVPMRPVVSGDLVFVRMITRQGPRLECIGLTDGVAKWVFSSRDQAATDPVLVEGDVVVLHLRRHEELGSELLFTRLARDTGEVLDERSLVNFRRASRSQLFRQFQIGRSIDRLVATGSGSVICTDLRGQLLWVRKQPWRPFEKKSNWYLHQPSRPVFSGNSVIVAQPADDSVTCLRSDTGGLLWKAPVRDLEKILGVSSGKIIVAASERMLALDFKDGRILWERQQLGGKGFLVSGDDSRILSLAPVSRSAEMKSSGWGAMGLMCWVDPEDGKELASWLVDFQSVAKSSDFQAGPMVTTGDGVFLFAGEYKGPSRNLFRLDPQRQFTALAQSGVALDNWLPGQGNLKATVARTLFPGWSLLDSGRSGKDPFVQEFPGSGAVFFTRSNASFGTQWGRMVKVPAGGKTRLKLQLGSDGAEGWKVVVKGNGETLAEKLIPEVPPASGKPEEYTWLEDSVPQSAQEQGGWVWARNPDPVHSGERSMMVSGKGRLEKSFRSSTYWLLASPGDRLFAWVWIDPKDPPRVIQLKFGGEAPAGMFGHSVFWGDLQALGEPPPAPTPQRMGNLPAAGQWVRLEIPAERMGIKPGTELRQMAFLQVDGTVYYDKVGIVSRSLPRGLPVELLGARRWTDLDVDLSRFGGKSVWLRVERSVDGDKKANELWRTIEVVD
ncbi:MAG: PQQ-binding-like beta-propeller repeat protein [Planctomycetota bacterium]|nr:PQQ-binding-like beta-propeller repeat protein [Planctomycetota bacterium]